MVKFFLLFFLFLHFSLQAFEISRDTIIVKSGNFKILNIASNNLAHYLKNIFAHSIKIQKTLPQDAKSVIVLKKQDMNIPQDSFIIYTKGSKLFIVGQNNRGVLYGAFYFLERYLGVKFLSENFEYIPHYKKISFKKIKDSQIPAFWYREVFIHEGDDLLFSFKNLLNGRLGHRTLDSNQKKYTSGINTYGYPSSELLGDKYSCNGQYEYANPKAQKEAGDVLAKKLAKLDKNKPCIVTLEHEDRGSTCHESGMTPSEAFLNYTIYLAKRFQKRYPNIHFYHQAYLWSREVPKSVKKLPPNLGVHFAPIEANFAKPLNQDENKKMWQQIEGWSKLSDDIIIWHYTINFGGYLFPFPNMQALAKDIKNLHTIPSVKGIFLQGDYESAGGDLSQLRHWVFAKLLWNPNQNIDDLTKEFCQYYYGIASKYVLSYMSQRESFLKKSNNSLYVKTPIDSNFLSDENLEYLNTTLEKGLKKLKKGTPYYEHYLALFLGIDYIRLIRGKEFSNREHVKRRFLNYLKKHPDVTNIAEGISTENLIKIINLKRKTAQPPKVAVGKQKGKSWLSYQEYQLELCCADIVEDSQASDGVSAVMPGSSEEWGFSLKIRNLPKGVWDVYADVKIEISKKGILDNARWALRYGIEPGISKSIKFTAQFDRGYKSIKIGTIDTSTDSPDFVWLSPPGNRTVDKVYVDRIYFIKR